MTDARTLTPRFRDSKLRIGGRPGHPGAGRRTVAARTLLTGKGK